MVFMVVCFKNMWLFVYIRKRKINSENNCMNNFLILYSSYTHGKTSEDILLNLLQLVQKFISYKLLLCAAHMASFAKLVFPFWH